MKYKASKSRFRPQLLLRLLLINEPHHKQKNRYTTLLRLILTNKAKNDILAIFFKLFT